MELQVDYSINPVNPASAAEGLVSTVGMAETLSGHLEMPLVEETIEPDAEPSTTSSSCPAVRRRVFGWSAVDTGGRQVARRRALLRTG